MPAALTYLGACTKIRVGLEWMYLVTRVSVPAALTYLGACTRIGVGFDGMYW